MKLHRWFVIMLCAFALILGATSGCEGEKKGKEEKAEGGGGEKKAFKVELEETSDDAFGYSIKIPKGSKSLAKDELMGHTFSLIIPGGLFEFNTSIKKLPASSLDDAVNTATMMGQKELTEKVEIEGGGYRIVKAPRGPLQEVWVFKGSGDAARTAKCSGPKEHLDKLLEICNSLAIK